MHSKVGVAGIWKICTGVLGCAVALLGAHVWTAHASRDVRSPQATAESFGQSLPAHVVAEADVSHSAADISKVYYSGYLKSGEGVDFSQWYEMCATPPADKYVLEYQFFNLVGDRSCGAWAECRQRTQTPTMVCWDFRMQGHNEWNPSHIGPFSAHDGKGVGLSQGVLSVYWKPQ